MSREDRLASLVTQLDSDPRYALGSRRFPGYVTNDDAVDIASAFAAEFDEGAAMRGKYAAQKGLQIACKSGCNDCCRIQVVVYAPEAQRIARYLLEPAHAAEREAFLAAYPAWRAQLGDAPERLAELGKDPDKKAQYERLHIELWRKGVLCAFNEDGRCSVYAVRPLVCRNANALDTAERCAPGSDKPAASAQFVPLDDFLKKSTRLMHAVHNAVSPSRHHQESLPSAVFKLLEKAKTKPATPAALGLSLGVGKPSGLPKTPAKT
jgi:Fe-S-cluster containining protein